MDKKISAVEASVLRENNRETVFLDVREASELAICRVKGALHIPMGEIPARLDTLPKTGPLVVFCHHGMRSQQVVQYLETRGFENAINLVGGIQSWADSVEPEMARY